MRKHTILSLLASGLLLFDVCGSADAGLLDVFRKKPDMHNDTKLTYDGRDMFVYVPTHLEPVGKRALVIVLHGGMGNAQNLVSGSAEKGLNMDAVAEKDGFIVAYLNGTRVSQFFREERKGWNAGDCCGLPSQNNVDDVGYISGAVKYLTDHYAIDPQRVFAIGHSNGAMMAMRMLCETDIFSAIVPVSGAIEIKGECSHAGDKYVYAIRGENDQNVPYNGGKGKGISGTDFRSQEYTKQVFIHAGAEYALQIIPNAEHKFDTIDAGLQKLEGITVAEKAALFFAQHPLKPKP